MGLAISKSNQQGFVLVFFLALLPVLIMAISGLIMVLLHLQAQSEARHTCRKELFIAEKSTAQNLTELMRLNPQAQRLRLQLKIAYLKLAAAGTNAAAEAAALAEIEKIQQQKVALDQQQKNLITQSELALHVGALQSQIAVRTSVHQKQNSFAQIANLVLTDLHSSSSHLAVRPDVAGETAPVYELETPFKEKQSLQTFWKWDFIWNKKTWKKIHVEDNCKVSIEEKNGLFKAVLNEDRY